MPAAAFASRRAGRFSARGGRRRLHSSGATAFGAGSVKVNVLPCPSTPSLSTEMRTAMHFDKLPGDRQPQARARRCENERIFAAEEALKDALLLACSNADPVIGHVDLDLRSPWHGRVR